MDMHNTLNALPDSARVESWVKQSGLKCEEVVDPSAIAFDSGESTVTVEWVAAEL